jgi:hypothetical protein
VLPTLVGPQNLPIFNARSDAICRSSSGSNTGPKVFGQWSLGDSNP